MHLALMQGFIAQLVLSCATKLTILTPLSNLLPRMDTFEILGSDVSLSLSVLRSRVSPPK